MFLISEKPPKTNKQNINGSESDFSLILSLILLTINFRFPSNSASNFTFFESITCKNKIKELNFN